MADMTPLADILNGDDADATPLQSNFQIIEAYVNGTNLIRTDGTEVMAADLDMDANKIVNLADGVADDDGVNMGQLKGVPPRGTIGYSEITTDATGIVLVTIVLSITFTAVAGRRYKATFQGELYQSIAGDTFNISIDNTSVALSRWIGSNGDTGAKTRQVQYVSNSSISGSTTWRATLQRTAGSGDGNIGAASDRPAFLLIEDIGAL